MITIDSGPGIAVREATLFAFDDPLPESVGRSAPAVLGPTFFALVDLLAAIPRLHISTNVHST